jgi:ribosomal protein S18 acetylase RimI-like enzyme
MAISFRQIIESDVDTVIPYIRELHAQDHISVDEPILRSALTGLIEDESKGRIWMIRDGAVPVGYAVLTYGYSLEFHGRDAFLDELFITKRYRGRGVGRQAMQFLLKECGKAGVHALRLEVDRSNTPAQEFYRKAGFIDHDRYLMTKWLP